jgi:hypothetical protein
LAPLPAPTFALLFISILMVLYPEGFSVCPAMGDYFDCFSFFHAISLSIGHHSLLLYAVVLGLTIDTVCILAFLSI